MAEAIAAVSGGRMPCAVNLLRISGDRALEVLDRVFTAKCGRSAAEWTPRKMMLGTLHARRGEVIDSCLAAVFPAGHSYTGEAMAEIFIHGAPAVAAEGLAHLYAVGCRPAERGEFTERAFLNGRMDLSEAEAVADLLDARTTAEAAAAVRQIEGALSARIRPLRKELTGLLAHFYAVCDYTDEDIEPFEYAQAAGLLERSARELRALADSYARGRWLREGLPVTIVGRPNAGKSTLFNALAGEERAIVTDEAGTTRDLIDVLVELDGTPIRLRDTAGLREAESRAENLGIERAQQAAQEAGVLLCLFDATTPLSPEDERAIELAKRHNNPAICITKCDLAAPDDPKTQALADVLRARSGCARVFYLAPPDGKLGGLPAWLASLAPAAEEVTVTGPRQAALLQSAADDLALAAESARMGMTADAFLSDAERALDHLGRITGEMASEEIVQEIFSRFCVGK